MVITKAKFWSKAVQGTNVEHVKIGYTDGDTETIVHEQGPCAVATEKFYNAFWNLPLYVTKICGLDEGLKTGIAIRDIALTPSEDKNGNDTTEYKLLCTLKAGHANAVLAVSIQHKYIPEGFELAMKNLIEQAEKYVAGERSQVELLQQKQEELQGELSLSQTEISPEESSQDGTQEFNEESAMDEYSEIN